MQVDDTPPLVSRSGKPIELLPSGLISLIANNAPTLAAIMHRGVRLKKVNTKWAKISPSLAAFTLARAFKVGSDLVETLKPDDSVETFVERLTAPSIHC